MNTSPARSGGAVLSKVCIAAREVRAVYDILIWQQLFIVEILLCFVAFLKWRVATACPFFRSRSRSDSSLIQHQASNTAAGRRSPLSRISSPLQTQCFFISKIILTRTHCVALKLKSGWCKYKQRRKTLPVLHFMSRPLLCNSHFVREQKQTG